MDKVIKLTHDSLIALIQGKKLHVIVEDSHFIFLPPTDRVFVTHEQLIAMRHQDQMRVLNFIRSLASYTQEEKDG